VVCSLEASGTQAGGVDWLSLIHKEIERSIAGIASQGNGKRLESWLVNRGFIGLVSSRSVGGLAACFVDDRLRSTGGLANGGVGSPT
jgi:hypothetical protein